MIPDRDQIEQAITAAAGSYGLDPAVLMKQCQTESSFNLCAKNFRTGATGLFQLEPPTAKDLGVTDIDNWMQNINGGAKYDRQLLDRFGSMDKALAAYNWGPGNLHHLVTLYPTDWRSRLPWETSQYLDKILGPVAPSPG